MVARLWRETASEPARPGRPGVRRRQPALGRRGGLRRRLGGGRRPRPEPRAAGRRARSRARRRRCGAGGGRELPDSCPSQPRPRSFSAAHDSLRKTRGAAMAVALVDHERREVRFCGVGNIAGVILMPEADPQHEHGLAQWHRRARDSQGSGIRLSVGFWCASGHALRRAGHAVGPRSLSRAVGAAPERDRRGPLPRLPAEA